jgi:hypothetical protein
MGVPSKWRFLFPVTSVLALSSCGDNQIALMKNLWGGSPSATESALELQAGEKGMARPGDSQAHFNAENDPFIDSMGAIISADLQFKGSHRKYSGSGGQPDSPFWQRVSSPVYKGKYAYKVVSQVGNGRNEQRILRDFAPRTDGARWFSFAINIDPSTAPVPGHFFFAQLHQSADGMNPPLFMVWTGSDWQLVVRTDDGVKGRNVRTVLATGAMGKGQWHEFKIKAKPGIKGTAELALWKKEGGAWSSKTLNWGSAPRNSFGFEFDSEGSLEGFDNFNFKVGMYRGSFGNQSVVYVDDLRYGKSEADLENAPGPAPQPTPQPPAPPAAVGKCFIEGGAGKTLFKDNVSFDACKKKCDDFKKSNPKRTCNFNGKRF